MSRQKYNESYYQDLIANSSESAARIIPFITELIAPKSVVDVGCGVGVWLSFFRKRGVEDILGIDGPWVNEKYLQIPKDKFLVHDLKTPLIINRKFDLVISLEVAEHLPQESAGNFVTSITGLGPVILFSAAIPMQGGILHINEQWPDYWIRLFESKGYSASNVIREKIWDIDVSPIYSQNLLLFVEEKHLAKMPALKQECGKIPVSHFCVVHPKFYLYRIDPKNMHLKDIVLALPALMKKFIKEKLDRFFKK